MERHFLYRYFIYKTSNYNEILGFMFLQFSMFVAMFCYQIQTSILINACVLFSCVLICSYVIYIVPMPLGSHIVVTFFMFMTIFVCLI